MPWFSFHQDTQGLYFWSCPGLEPSFPSLAGSIVLSGEMLFCLFQRQCIIDRVTWKSWKGTSYLLLRAGRRLQSMAPCTWAAVVLAVEGELCLTRGRAVRIGRLLCMHWCGQAHYAFTSLGMYESLTMYKIIKLAIKISSEAEMIARNPSR